MKIPINANVECVDGLCGQSTHVVVNRQTQELTYLVVRGMRPPHTEHLVPVNDVVETTGAEIRLRCARKDVAAMDTFLVNEYVTAEMPAYEDSYDAAVMLAVGVPYVTKRITVGVEQIKVEELAVRRFARVEATDGQVGQVDELAVDATTGRITHLVMRAGHLWQERDVTIPVSAIDHADEYAVYLNLDKKAVAELPFTQVAP